MIDSLILNLTKQTNPKHFCLHNSFRDPFGVELSFRTIQRLKKNVLEDLTVENSPTFSAFSTGIKIGN